MSLFRSLVLLSAVFACPAALAGIIVSGDGSEGCRMASSGDACTAETVSAHPLWQTGNPNGNGADWISYADTGYLGSTLAVAPGGEPSAPLMQVREVLLDVTAGTRLVMDLWADDTAEVQLRFDDGSGFAGSLLATLLTPNFTQNVCADGPNGCEPEDRAHFEYVFSDEDLATVAGSEIWLDFTTFQVGTGITNRANPFGLLYSGRIELALATPGAVAVPEPPSLALLAGAGVICLVFVRRRQRG